MKYDWLEWDEEDVAQYEDARAHYKEGQRMMQAGINHLQWSMRDASKLRVPAAFKNWLIAQSKRWKQVDENTSRELLRNNFNEFDYMLTHPEEFEADIQEAQKFASQEKAAFTDGVLAKIIKEYGFSPDEHSVEDVVQVLVADEVIADGDGRHQLQVEIAAERLGFGYEHPSRQPRFRG